MTTLVEAQARLAEYMAAESECLATGQEVRMTSANGVDRTSVMADLRSIQQGLAFWRGQVALLTAKANGQATFAGMTFSSANFGNATTR
jgi:hypothetical protein